MIAVQGAERDCASKKEKYEKYKELYQKGSISEQDLKDIQAVYNSAESTLADANQRLQISENNLNRITSYNVCYTKLLRTSKYIREVSLPNLLLI